MQGETVTFFGDCFVFVVTFGITVIVPVVELHSIQRYIQSSLSISAASGCLHIHLGLGTFFRFGLGATSPCRGFWTISDIYVMAIYHFYKGGKKTFYILAITIASRNSDLMVWPSRPVTLWFGRHAQ